MSLIAGNLGIIQRLLDAHDIVWGIYGGSSAHLYGNRRPIRNIDIVVTTGSLKVLSQAMKDAKRIGQFDGRRIMWSGINLCEDLSVRRGGISYPFKLDQPMIDHLRRMPLLGSRVSFLAPEDALIHKLLVSDQMAEGQKDYDDAASIAQRQTLDQDYVAERIKLCNAATILTPHLEKFGVLPTNNA